MTSTAFRVATRFLLRRVARYAACCERRAHTKPKFVESGVAQSTSMIYVGDSFFYYNASFEGGLCKPVSLGTPSTRTA